MTLHCNPFNTYTLYSNILGIISLIIFNKTYLQGLGLHVIPLFLIAEYLVWFKGLAGSCNRPWWLIIVGDILAHWLPLIVYMYLELSDKIEYGEYTIYGFLSPFVLFLLYIIKIKCNMRVYNGIDIRPYLIAYLLLLIVITIIFAINK